MLLKAENVHGGDVYKNKIILDYSANVSPLGTPPKVKDAIVKSLDTIVQYPDPYCTELRKSIANHHKVSYDYIICGNGAADVIFSFALALKPKKALIVSPTFSEYEKALGNCDCQIEYYCLQEKNNFELQEDILVIIEDGFDAVFICNPNNPTGVLYTKKLLLKISNCCKKNNTFLFIDECFMDLTKAVEEHSLCQDIMQNDKIFILKAFTKSFGMAGVRLGYGLCSNTEFLEKMSSTTQVWNVSSLAQTAGCAALEDNEFLQNLIELIEQERKFVYANLVKLGFKVYKGNANFLLFRGEKNLYDKLFKQGIMIRKCANFIGIDDTFYRCAIKTRKENIRFIKALKERDL